MSMGMSWIPTWNHPDEEDEVFRIVEGEITREYPSVVNEVPISVDGWNSYSAPIYSLLGPDLSGFGSPTSTLS